NGIDCNCENDWDGRCRLLCGYCRASHCEDDIDLKPNEFGRDLGKSLVASIRPAIFDCNGTAIGPAEFTQSPHKGRRPTTPGRGRACTQKPEGGRLARRRGASRERPRCGCAAKQRDEFAAFHYPMPPVLQIERIANLSYGRRLLRCGILFQAMSLVGQSLRIVPLA